MSDQDPKYLQTPEQWVRFLSAFVHELRTPISSFRMLADLLADAPQDRLGNQERRYAENLREVVQDIQSLVGDAAELARLLAGREQIKPGEVVLEELVDEVEQALRPRAWEGGVALTDFLDSALPKPFRTDPDRLRRIFSLLLGTTISHAKSEVFFQLYADGTDLHAVISSDGPPFSEAALQDVFEPFKDGFRAARHHGGRSLALPLANELTRVLRGTLQAENRGERPTFDLFLPAIGS